MMHVVMGLRAYEAPFSHDDTRRGEVLHPVTPLELVAPHLSLHGAQNLDAFAVLPQKKSRARFPFVKVTGVSRSRVFHKAVAFT